MGKPRKVPRSFTMPWGGGQVVEEVGVDTEHNELGAMREALKGAPAVRALLKRLVED